ncbi:MAG: hypothetical protein AAFP19_19090, partial [Bacteroidota bacterium]
MNLNNYDFKKQVPKLSNQQIESHMDFDALLTQFEEQPQATEPRPRRLLYLIVGLAAAAMIGFMLYQTIATNSYDAASEAYFAEQEYVNPPLPDIAAEYQGQTVSAKGGTVKYENGSKITVPPAAFVDQNGQAVEGDVEVRYREFHDYVDFFLSGIPMEYDSAGVRYQLESAGMIEIFAEQNGQRLNVAPGKSIDVELTSEIAVPASYKGGIPQFNVYKLDGQERNWSYRGRDQIEVLSSGQVEEALSEESKAQQAYEQDLAQIDAERSAELAIIEGAVPKPIAPIKPALRDPDAYSFELDFEEDDFTSSTNNQLVETARAEMEAAQEQVQAWRKKYENSIWQVIEEDNFDQQAAAGTNWEDMKIRQLSKRNYELTLIAPNKEMKLIVSPVLSNKDYTDALEDFNEEFAAYQTE